MSKLARLLFICGAIFLLPNLLQATHNRAGEISVEQVGDCQTSLTVKATITTYTKASSIAADRDSLQICWGDGFCEMVARSNGNGTALPNDTKLNLYVAFHTYPGRGTFEISMTDPNRNEGILNVNFPNSVTVPFHLQTNYTFLNCQFDGTNSTPILLQPPIDIGCVGQPFEHNPLPIDPDDDSLSFQLVVPLQAVDVPVPNYQWPNEVGVSPDNNYQLNQITGIFTWDAPQIAGEYNIAMYIISWRGGVAIDTVLRDMQILIQDCGDNRPPEIETEDFICVVAGETVNFDVIATDPDAGQMVELTALGGPFEVSTGQATFNAPTGYQVPPVIGNFNWNTTCEHIRGQPYTIVFRAIDNFAGNFGLADLKTVRILVVGPAPEDVQAEPQSNQINVSWFDPYVCEEVDDDYFIGFSVWRREGSNPFVVDDCEPGLDGKGYSRMIVNTNEVQNGRYFFADTDVERGRTYCYRILARFARETSIEPPQYYNVVESLPSLEVCMQLSRDVPLMTNVDVDVTSTTNGQIKVKWTKPDPEDLDTLQNPGPYTYEVLRSTGIREDGFTPIGVSFTSPTFWQANDTSFTDVNLNTTDNAYTYQIAFYTEGNTSSSGEPLGFSNFASSPFLGIASTDETNNLSWEYDVPWENFKHNVYRLNGLGDWVQIGTTEEPFYSDQGLVNGREYCYYVETIGDYNVDGIDGPLLNRSQESCGIPLDTIPPCPPELTVNNLCNDEAFSCIESDLVNDLEWINPMNLCAETDDVVTYRVYYAPFEDSEFEFLTVIDFATDTVFEHRPEFGIAGCYAVTAVDTFDNESRFSNIFCVDNCPVYELPNAFTPNGDNQNDLFIPYPYCFIEEVEFQVVNRWGEVVFETTDPDLNWDGKNRRGQDLPQGVYYYTCKVFERRVSGIVPGPEILKGYIELVRDVR